MSNIALNRIISQKGDFYSHTTIVPKTIVQVSQPLQLEELKNMLEQELVDTVPIVAETTLEIKFENIFDFCDWYTVNSTKFSDKQNEALNTLVRARDTINIGCNCTRPNRERGAHEYFKSFWINNFHTDIMPNLLKIAGAKKVFFGNFLIYPA